MSELLKSLKTGFINRQFESEIKYRPQLLVNDYSTGQQMLNELKNQLMSCDTFAFSVAFIAQSGLAVLRQTLLDLAEKAIHGRLVTSTYLGFNSPTMFEELLAFDHLEVRLFADELRGFHPKGYIFKKNDMYKITVGSSNLTQSALETNKEWNICFTSLKDGEIVDQIRKEFDDQWKHATPLTREWIEGYKQVYQVPEHANKPLLIRQKVTPNKMQKEALASLAKLRGEGKDKALLISATGTGKTYLSAFDVAAFKPKRMLFVVHRENIAQAAMDTFKRVMPDHSMALYTGHSRETGADYLFATIQTISKSEHYQKFSSDEFDYIIIDEVHRAGAASYQRLVNYFKPSFLLGMTATPERSDDFDIFKMFDHNIAYEIRLQQAMEYDLLCPFHYYGITDLIIDDEVIDDHSDFNLLVSDTRVHYILENIKKYGHAGDQVKGLIFCSRKDEAKTLSLKLNEQGLHTMALTGESSEETRQRAMDSLESDEPDSLDYILTVDIFNEGIDIPAVNQVVMLRPTQSAIVFVQQLGRGLRKYPGKDYVVVIDFIGNYEHNFMIPIALSGSMAYNKDDLRKFIQEGSLIVPGCSTINFDLISKERIYHSIDAANFNQVKIIKDSYKQLKEKLGRIPRLIEFDQYQAIDPLRIFENSSLGSYHEFLTKYEKDYHVVFTSSQRNNLIYLSSKLASGKRVQELEAIKTTIFKQHRIMTYLKKTLKEEYGLPLAVSYDTIINILTQNFITGTGKKKFAESVFIQKENDDYEISNSFLKELENDEFKRQVLEIVDYGIHRFKENYQEHDHDTDFCLNKKYTYDEVCRLLNWDKGVVALNIGGYRYDEKTNTFPVFINYNKDTDISDTTKYEDHFIDQQTLIAYSKNNRTIQSDEVQRVYHEDQSKVQVYLFVRKDKNDNSRSGKEFYYLGRMHAIGQPEEEIMNNTKNNVVKLMYRLEHPVNKELYDYITM